MAHNIYLPKPITIKMHEFPRGTRSSVQSFSQRQNVPRGAYIRLRCPSYGESSLLSLAAGRHLRDFCDNLYCKIAFFHRDQPATLVYLRFIFTPRIQPVPGHNDSRLRSFRSVLRATLPPVSYSRCIQNAPDGVITNTGQILYAPPANQHDRMFLEIMALATDVTGNFKAVRQSHSGNLPECRIRLLWSGRIYPSTHPSFLRGLRQRRHSRLLDMSVTRLPHKLVECWLKFAFQIPVKHYLLGGSERA